VRALRLELTRADLPLLALGAFGTFALALATTRVGEVVSLGGIAVLLLFAALLTGFVAAPHLMVPATIPLFAFLPTLKVFGTEWLGPLKDLVSIAAIAAAAVLVVKRSSAASQQRGDFWIGAIVVALLALYVLNVGGSLEKDLGWVHGVRLFAQPLLLLVAGLMLGDARRTFRWAMVSLVATACVVAFYGIVQQGLGHGRLFALGYDYNVQLRFFGDRIRSFGTMDEPFAYAAFLLMALAAVLFFRWNGPAPYIAGALIVVGLSLSFVRSALLVSLGLLGLWFARQKRPTISFFLMAASTVGALVVLAAFSGATETQTTRTGSSTFLTVNGRTEGWKIYLNDPKVWAVGHGVGEVGTAAERARYSISRGTQPAEETIYAVDSGYFAIIADVGLVGLAVFLALVGRILMLGRAAIRRGSTAGWLAVAFLAVLLLDAVTRATFTGFPTAFLGFLLVGLALGAANEEEETRARPDEEALLASR
jgi:O-Antigen ligase